jgi:DNA segregation ATPase FtsK/SpoIIIE, S-DNA-T family
MSATRAAVSPAPLQGILLLLLAALAGLALGTRIQTHPACGPLADWLADHLVASVGPILAWALWALLLPVAVLWLLGRQKRSILRWVVGIFPFLIVLSVAVVPVDSLRGSLGAKALAGLQEILGPWGSWIGLAALLLVTGWICWRVCLPGTWRDAMGRRFERSVEKASPETSPLRPTRRDARREPGRVSEKRPSIPASGVATEDEEEDEEAEQEEERPPRLPEPQIRTRRPTPVKAPAPFRPGSLEEHRKLPDVSLLEDLDGTRAGIERDEIIETSRLLTRTLKDFGVQGRVGEVHPGPVVTRYEFEPGTGVRVNQIVSRIDDLALALRASRIRLVAPIPGKAAVGIEVPNRRQAMISLKEILDSEEFRAQQGPLVLALGRDISGAPVFARLDQMPHLLVAGTTGSGKSVCLNGLLFSLLFRRTPEELRFLLIDPKRIELTPYDGIPSLLCPVVTEPKHATRMLEWLCGEMDRRYRVFRQLGVRNVEGFQRRAASSAEQQDPLPYIVVVVDELADLMLTQGIEIEGPISRLAHMARAVGIHMILATQRPSVDVLTGVIKANFPARIAFQVASRIDSRTILDAGGAEFLLGRGDMLFVPPGKAEAVRVHGAYCTEGDAERVANFLREQPPATPLVREDEGEEGVSDPAKEDEMFADALRLVVRERQASVSFLQRRLKVGYSRAARLMDLLEAAGVVSPYDGSKARDVMVDESFLESWHEQQKPQSGQP